LSVEEAHGEAIVAEFEHPERSRKGDEPKRTPSTPQQKGVTGSERPEASHASFLRELKRAARGLLDKRSPQD
jgi:hypothetical protein